MLDRQQVGLLFGVAAYFLWGVLPIYFHALAHIPPLEVVAHRIFWSAITLVFLLLYKKRMWFAIQQLAILKQVMRFGLAGLLISSNWLIYIYAITNNLTIDASLGYFINPVFIILLGAIFFQERLGKAKLVCTGLAILGVLYLIAKSATFSWISVVLPITFGFYGVIKKQSNIDSLTGLFMETLLLSPLAIAYFIYLNQQNNFQFLQSSQMDITLLSAAGIVTTTPLLFFAASAKRIEYSSVGFLQYIAPTLQFIIGLFVFRESLDIHKLIGFIFVWVGLVILVTTQLHQRSYNRAKIKRNEKYANNNTIGTK